MDINGIHHINSAHGINGPHFEGVKKTQASAESIQNQPITDEVEISTTARRLSETTGAEMTPAESGEIRYELVNRVREQIAAGTYDTPERFDKAMEKFLSRIG